MVVLGLQKRSTTYAYEKARNQFKVLPPDHELENLAIAYYQTAVELYTGRKYQ